MSTILTIFKKELLEVDRDRKTMISMFLPLLIFPLIIGIATKIITKKNRAEEIKVLQVAAFVPQSVDLVQYSPEDIQWRSDLTLAQADSMLIAEELDAIVVFPENFLANVGNLGTETIELQYKRVDGKGAARNRVNDVLNAYKAELLKQRFAGLGLPETASEPFEIKWINKASQRERMGTALGGLLPYMFILFSLMGCMHPAIDLVAGEKERGTFETLLSSPAGKMDILTGKFLVVILVGLSTTVISLLGLIVSVTQIKGIPEVIQNAVGMILEPGSVIVVLSMLIPLTVFFAAVLLALSVGAKSYKEAQSAMGPLMPVVIVPAYIGLLPGIDLTVTTALIPIINVSLACKTVLAGTAETLPIIIVYASMIGYAVLGLWICSKIFHNDESLLKGL